MPWEQRKAEPARSYASFLLYLRQGPARSLTEAAEECGLSLGRLKQLSSQWRWPGRAAAWDRHRFLSRRRQELEEAKQARQRLLKEAADWQSLARKQISSWVRRGRDGQLRLTRELTPLQALRLWRVGSQAESALRGIVAPAPKGGANNLADSSFEQETARFREATEQASYVLASSAADYHVREEVRRALVGVARAWIETSEYVDRYGKGESIADTLWPWHQPFAEA